MNEVCSPVGMKIPANPVVGEGYQTLPDMALPCPYVNFLMPSLCRSGGFQTRADQRRTTSIFTGDEEGG